MRNNLDLAYEAVEETPSPSWPERNRCHRSQITEFRAQLDTRLTRKEVEIKAQGPRIDNIESRIDNLRKVIWPLIGLLGITVFGLLYKAVTSGS